MIKPDNFVDKHRIDAPDTAEGLIKSVTMIPATGEFQYGTTPVSRGTGGTTASENVHSRGIVVRADGRICHLNHHHP